MMKLRLIVWLLLTVVLFAGCGGGKLAPGKPAPEFELGTLDGQMLSLSQFRGSPVLLNFWATWCGPCRREMPYLQKVYERWQGVGLVLLAINIGESPPDVAEFMQAGRFTFPVLMDVSGEVATRYGIEGIPTTFFIDAEGIIQEVQVGAFPSAAEIEKSLFKLFD